MNQLWHCDIRGLGRKAFQSGRRQGIAYLERTAIAAQDLRCRQHQWSTIQYLLAKVGLEAGLSIRGLQSYGVGCSEA